VLDTYCANSGQLVSLSKSSIYFSSNTRFYILILKLFLISTLASQPW
jgi:hypothetical protein